MDDPLNRFSKLADDVMRTAQLAAALEVSGWPKPGNVHRTAEFRDTTFEHFVAGSIALGPQIRRATTMGIEAGLGRIGLGEVCVGDTIDRIIEDIKSWHRGGNTHLGTSLLFVPLSISAGYTYAKTSRLRVSEVRRNVFRVMRATTVKDALKFQGAIEKVVPAGLGRLGDKNLPDVSKKESRRVIADKGLTLYDIMKASSSWDNIAREWVTGMETSFCLGSPTWSITRKETGNVNTATVQTFLTILSKFPDTLIARKVGMKKTDDVEKAVRIGLVKARKISEWASNILSMGGAKTSDGISALWKFDRALRSKRSELNPGTTADLTSSSIMISLLSGERP